MTIIEVLTVDKRKRIPQEAIDELVRQIAEQFHPQKIILFGSRARGAAAGKRRGFAGGDGNTT